MIWFEGRAYARVWKVTPSASGKYIDLQISTSEKNEAGEYINSSWFPRVLGSALTNLKDVQRGDDILIKKAKFTNVSTRQEDGRYRSFFNMLVLDAEITKRGGEGAPSAPTGTPRTRPAAPAKAPDPEPPTMDAYEDDPECPW